MSLIMVGHGWAPKNIFHSRSPITTLNSIFFFFFFFFFLIVLSYCKTSDLNLVRNSTHKQMKKRIVYASINHSHERCLHIVYSDKTSSFKKLLETDRSALVHIRNLQIFATEFFKESKDLACTIFSQFFSKRNVQCNLRHASELSAPDMKSTFHSTKCLSNLGPKI